MNKGCVIAAVIVGLIVVVCAGITIYVSVNYANPLVLVAFESGIDSYKAKHPEAKVETTNEAWVAALTAPDSGVDPQIVDAVKKSAAAGGGKFMDIYGTAVDVKERPDGTLQVISAGKDGQFGTQDDENSDKVKALMKGGAAK